MVEQREVFQRQPARAVLIDFSPPITLDTLLNIQQSLSNTLSLLSHLSGGHVRVPFLSLIVLGNYPEAVFPLQPLKGNSARLTSALKELGSLARNMVARQRPTRGCLLEGLQEALAQFNRLTQNYKQGPGSTSVPLQIDITLLTSLPSVTVRSMVEKMTDHLNLQHLKIINAVCLSDPDQPVMMETVVEEVMDHSSPSELGLSMLEVTSLDNDVLNLQSVFQGWLLDCGTDSEHLHLSLPPTLHGVTGRESGTLSSQLVLKCDMHERLLDPHLIGGGKGQQFALNGSAGIRGSSNSSLQPPNLPVHKLTATAVVATEGVCESVLFGLPQILKPTACWKLDWEDLEMNQQLFSALCQHLRNRNQVLIAKAETNSQFNPHYLILPSSSQSLLIKSLAVNELLLPMEPSTSIEQPSSEVQQSLVKSLDQLDCFDTYNPLLIPCGLYETLTPSRRGPAPSRGTNPPASHTTNRGRTTAATLGTRRSYNKKGSAFQYH